MNDRFFSALDASLSGLEFTERMQQNVLQQIRTPAPAKQATARRSWMLPTLSAAAALLLMVIGLNRVNHIMDQTGDPITAPASTNAAAAPTFAPIAPDPTFTAVPTQEITPAPTVTSSPSPTPTATPSPTPTSTPSPTPTATPSPTPTATPSPTPTATPSPTPTATPSPTPTATPSPTPTATPSPTPTATPSPTSTATPSPTPTATPTPTPLVGVVLSPREPPNNYTHQDYTLYVYPDQLTQLDARFAWTKPLPEGTVLRLIRINGLNGDYGEAPIQTSADGKTYSALISYDGQVGYFDYLKVAAIAPDESTVFSLNYQMSHVLFGKSEWMEMDRITDSNDLPFQVRFRQQKSKALVEQEIAELEVNPDDTSTLTFRFRYADELPEGALVRMTRVDGTDGHYGEAQILPTAREDLLEAVLHFDQQVGHMEYFTLQGLSPDGTLLFETSHQLYSDLEYPKRWLTMPALRPSLAAATEPPYKSALVKATYSLQDKVTKYAHYNTTYRQYEDFNTLNVFFFYKAELPEGAYMQVLEADGVPGAYGSAVIGPANVEGTDPELLNAKIFSYNLPVCQTVLTACYAPDGTELFRAGFKLKEVSYPSGHGSGSAAGNATPVPPGYDDDYSILDSITGRPTPTPWYSWIQDGMYIKTPTPYDYVQPTPNPFGWSSGWGW